MVSVSPDTRQRRHATRPVKQLLLQQQRRTARWCAVWGFPVRKGTALALRAACGERGPTAAAVAAAVAAAAEPGSSTSSCCCVVVVLAAAAAPASDASSSAMDFRGGVAGVRRRLPSYQQQQRWWRLNNGMAPSELQSRTCLAVDLFGHVECVGQRWVDRLAASNPSHPEMLAWKTATAASQRTRMR